MRRVTFAPMRVADLGAFDHSRFGNVRIDIAAAEEERRPIEAALIHPTWFPAGPIAPPLNATKPPKRDAFLIANSVVRHAPCEKPSMTMRSRLMPAASISRHQRLQYR